MNSKNLRSNQLNKKLNNKIYRLFIIITRLAVGSGFGLYIRDRPAALDFKDRLDSLRIRILTKRVNRARLKLVYIPYI